ncbi:MAG TPA: hypothetical protein VH475_04245 [Tepidisphaeraceae bacterium]
MPNARIFRRRRRRLARRRGYVLVMVLALLVLSATLMVAVGRAAMRTAIAARSAEDDLQRRWAVASCRKAVLPYAEQILSALEQERRQPAPRFETSLHLGRQTLALVIADEQAKANVNALLDGTDQARADSRLRQGLAGSGLLNRLRLRPTYGPVIRSIQTPTTGPATRPLLSTNALHVGSFGQIFDDLPPAQLLRPMPGSRIAAADLLTCWGNGAVNVRRATEAALTLAAGRSLTGVEISRLIDARNKLFERKGNESSFDTPAADNLQDAMNKAMSQSIRNRGNLGLAERSTCHSLWIVTRTGRRDEYDLFVLDQANVNRPQVWAFSW